MKRILTMVTVVGLFLSSPALAAGDKPEAPKDQSLAPAQELGYALGMQIGASLKEMGGEIDLAAFVRGLTDSYEGKKLLLTPEKAAEIKKEFGAKMHQKRKDEMKSQSEKNLKLGEAFLAENKDKAGVVTTASGLQYKVINKGDGPTPKATDRVSVHYRGTLIDGTEFDSSYKRGVPVTFAVNGVIAGWTEALQLMTVASKYQLFIPAMLAYGDRGTGKIGPNSMLIFEVELREIKKGGSMKKNPHSPH